MLLKRYPRNPLISPSQNWWEILATFNAGATIFEDKVLLVYRAIGGDNISRFGMATSADGYNFERFEKPLFEADPDSPYERLGVEDPRITKIDEAYFICYTSASVYPASNYYSGKFAPSLSHPAPWRVRPSLITTKDFRTFQRRGILLDIDSKDALLLPEKIDGNYVLFHRPYPNIKIAISKDLEDWTDLEEIIGPRKGFWDSERVGIGSVPIKTEKGWLVFYSGASVNRLYCLGILLLDLEDPTKVLYRSQEPVLSPETDYELNGLTSNVIFTCSALEKDDQFFVYYGAADKTVALATISKEELFNSIL